MNDLPDVLTRLEARVETLEQRVYVLEHPAGATQEALAEESGPATAATPNEGLSPAIAGGFFPVLGKAMLGIAGAYLLRAVAESSSLPKTAVAAVAIVYAIGWLVWASRVKAGDWTAGTIYACTSALILAPMLWELTLRFQVLPAWVSASVVLGFVLAASALAWKRDFAPVLWVANGTAVAIALALAVASHQITPFISVLLLMVLVGEFAAQRGHESGTRVLVTLTADFVLWAEIYVYSGPENARTQYSSLSVVELLVPGMALFLILGLSLLLKTVLRGKAISVFETIEMMIAFLLAGCALMYFGPASSAMMLGSFCLVLAGAGYAVSFLRFNRQDQRRNYLVYLNWSGALLLAGCLLCLPQSWQVALLSASAVAATFAGARLGRFVLELHGMVFLVAAAWISGLGAEVFNALAGPLPGIPGIGICVVSAGAVLCYAAIRPCEAKTWTRQMVLFVFAAVSVGVLAALAVQGLAGLLALTLVIETHHLAFIRTSMVCVAAVALAYSGAHWRRMELTRIGYATLALLALKLVAEDMRHGHLAFIAGSIFLFALTLIVVPRVARARQRV